MSAHAATRIAVTVATRGRPTGCVRLVDALLAQTLPREHQLQVIVVDNAADGSELHFPRDERVTVVREPRTGIPFARNQGVRQALEWADVIVFIDDDEVPADGWWLGALVDALVIEGADMATGPVRARFCDDSPRWIRRHPIFLDKERCVRQPLSKAYTSNLAVRSDVFHDLDRWFDERLRYCGGSDTEFTQRAVQAGARIVWADTAVVVEDVPRSRATVQWVLRRSRRLGANRVQRLRLRQASARSRALYTIGAGVEMCAGGLGALLTPLLGRHRGLIALGRAARGLGTLLAGAGFARIEEYRTVDEERLNRSLQPEVLSPTSTVAQYAPSRPSTAPTVLASSSRS